MLAFATPAAAHITAAYVYSGGVERGYASVEGNHMHGVVCDTKADSVGVYGRFKLDNGQIIDVSDDNGASSGCGEMWAPSGRYIVQIEAVWRGGATSGWKTA